MGHLVACLFHHREDLLGATLHAKVLRILDILPAQSCKIRAILVKPVEFGSKIGGVCMRENVVPGERVGLRRREGGIGNDGHTAACKRLHARHALNLHVGAMHVDVVCAHEIAQLVLLEKAEADVEPQVNRLLAKLVLDGTLAGKRHAHLLAMLGLGNCFEKGCLVLLRGKTAHVQYAQHAGGIGEIGLLIRRGLACLQPLLARIDERLRDAVRNHSELGGCPDFGQPVANLGRGALHA